MLLPRGQCIIKTVFIKSCFALTCDGYKLTLTFAVESSGTRDGMRVERERKEHGIIPGHSVERERKEHGTIPGHLVEDRVEIMSFESLPTSIY